MNPRQDSVEDFSVQPQIFFSSNAAILCVDRPTEVEMSLVAQKNVTRKWQIISYSVEKTNFNCKLLWFVQIKQLLGIVDFVWQVEYHVLEHFPDSVVKIACL